VWIPLAFRDYLVGAEGVFYGVIGRLARGNSVKQAQAEMDSIYRGLEQNDPTLTEANRILLQPLRRQFAGDIVPALRILVLAAGFVLLIACANVANLQLARGAARQKEMAIRSAMGAGRLRLLRQSLLESIGLAVVGGVVGLLLAGWATRGLVALGPTNVLSIGEVSVDWRVLVFTLTLSLVTGVLFGLAPAIQFSKPDLIEALKSGGRTSSDGSSHNRLRNVLVVAEVSMAMVLLIGAGLLLKSFVHLISVDPGLKADHVLTMEVSPPAITYPSPAQKAAFYQEVLQRITEVPGVDAVGVANHLPFKLTNGILFLNVYVEGKQAWEARMMAGYRVISPDYFRVMGIQVLRGRPFSEQDNLRSTPVVILSERLAKTAFGEEDAIGKRLIVGSSKGPVEIVGVVGNVRHFGLDDQPGSEFYLSYLQKPAPFMNIVVSSRLDPRNLAEAVRGEVWSVDPAQPVYNIRTMEDVISDSLSQRSFLLLLTGLFGLLAVSLASVGIYGVMSHSVNQRIHEIGVRMALGADRGAILRLILWRGLALVMPGVVIGGLAAAVLGRFLNAMLYDTVALDPVTFAAIPVLLMLVASVACYLPCRRATLVDPLASLRCE
jgi:putative ABC transport system permease protein